MNHTFPTLQSKLAPQRPISAVHSYDVGHRKLHQLHKPKHTSFSDAENIKATEVERSEVEPHHGHIDWS